ncbi:MAG: hypothetical protein OXQ28_08280 [Acidobacteriota bacterium]|nr:hypothetical protein [Acidobacteriota bacterium]
MPFTAANRQALEPISETPAVWIGGAILFLLFCVLVAHGLLTAVYTLATRITTQRSTPTDRRTVTIKQLKATTDYHAATAGERAAVAMLHPTAQLVREDEFEGHTAAVAREIVGDKCAMWPYRHINLEEAAEDLRESYASIRIGPATYYHAVR